MGKYDDNEAERHVIDIPVDHTIECSYDQLNYMVSSHRETNLLYLKSVQNHMNELLQIRGHVFLNEAFGRLHMPPTAVGQVCGWIKGPVDFGIDYSLEDDNPEIACTITHEGYILDHLS